MFYLLSAFFAWLALARTLHVNDNFFFHATLARTAQVNDLWLLFPVAFAAYYFGCFAAARSKDVLRVRCGIVDEYRLRAIHLHSADAVQVGFASSAALAIARHKRWCLVHDPVAVAQYLCAFRGCRGGVRRGGHHFA